MPARRTRRATSAAHGAPRGALVRRGLLGVAAVGVALLAAATGFPVDNVVVSGAPPARAAEIRAAALRAIGSDGLLRVDPAALGARLQALPAVRSARVDRAFPRTVEIRVEPEIPAAVVPLGRDRYLVARSGRVIGPATRHAGVPFLAAAPADVPPPGGTVAASGVLAELAVARALTPRSPLLVTGVQLVGGALVARSKRGFDIHLGDGTDLERKLVAATAAFRAMGPIDARSIAYVDVSAPDRPSVRTAVANPSTLVSPAPIVLDVGTAIDQASGGAQPAAAAVADAPPADPSALVLDLFGGGGA